MTETRTTPEGTQQPSDRRRVPRNSGVTIRPVKFSLAGEEYVATVEDISVLGVGLLTDRETPPGARLELSPVFRRAVIPAEVRHVRPHRGRWLLGCEFTRLPTANEIVALG